MSGPSSVSSLIAEIYQAALDPSRWSAALAEASYYIGGAAAGLWLSHYNPTSDLRCYFGGDEMFKERISAHQESVDSERENGIADTHDEAAGFPIIQSSEYLEARFGQQQEACVSRFAVYRHCQDDPWEEAALQRMRCITSHMRRAVTVNKLIHSNDTAAAAMADTLDNLAAGIFLLDAGGEILHANVSGNVMLAKGRVLRSVGGKLSTGVNGRSPISPSRDIFRFDPNRPAQFCLSDSTDPSREVYVAHLFPVAAGRRWGGKGSPVVAGLIVGRVNWHTSDAVARLAHYYRVPPREREVLEAIVQGRGFVKNLEALAITRSTMKTYLRRLFKKIGAREQLDIVSLCAAFRSPFV